MAGHSKWKQIKHYKAATDAKRGALFTKLIREITMAAKLGGGDPSGNPRLRLAIDTARSSSMPKENIERAIKKGTGELPGIVYEEITYEAYGPSGVAFIVKVTTDNKQRAAQDVRSVFAKHGGNLASSGAVAFQFLHAGQFLIAQGKTTEDALMELALEAGADDVLASEQGFEVRCNVQAFDKVSQALEQKGIKPDSAEIAYIPTTTVPVNDRNTAATIVKLQESLEELDDVQVVFSNEEIDEAIAAQV